MLILVVLVTAACGPAQSQEEAQDEPLEDSLELQEEPPETVDGEFVFKRKRNKYPQGYFRNPIDSPVLLSGSFCELRNNHFHGGLDIRTLGMEGMSIKAVADGYVSRIKVSPYGYGKALYITHPNGYTSVYGHLSKYSGAIEEYVNKAPIWEESVRD